MSQSSLAVSPTSLAYLRMRYIRQFVLYAVLAVLLFALWYDYRVARPAVNMAYDTVMRRNAEVNAAPAAISMTARDVRQLLGKSPDMIYAEGPYSIEVYSFVAGLPFRSHDYYAVYVGTGPNMALMRHYKFVLPMNELNPPRQLLAEEELASAARTEEEWMEYYSEYYEQMAGMQFTSPRDPARPRRPPLEFPEEEQVVTVAAEVASPSTGASPAPTSPLGP